MLSENTCSTIKVYSSIYASSIYEKLGFVKSDDLKEESGIIYIPMVYRMKINISCSCKKIKCVRHGRKDNGMSKYNPL